jgi:hypothetical protein
VKQEPPDRVEILALALQKRRGVFNLDYYRDEARFILDTLEG